jgi:hypothetical protein
MKYLKKLTNRLTDFLTYSKINNMEQTIYNVDFFITKFSAIDESDWCIEVLGDEYGRHCAMGHCGARPGRIRDGLFLTDEAKALIELFGGDIMDVTVINDNSWRYKDKRSVYKQPTPKQRILAALYDIKRAQYPEISEPPVYVEDLIGQPAHSTHQ